MNRINWNISIWIAVAGMLVIPLTGAAQHTTLTSLDDAFKLALTSNVDYQNYILNQKKADLEYKQAKAYRLPNITGSFSGQRNIDLAVTPLPGEIFGQPEQTIEAQFGQEYNYNAGITISKNLLNREASLQSKISKLNAKLTAVEKDVFEELLKEQVSLYYYTGLVAKRAIEIGHQDLESAESIRQLSQHKFDQGIIDALALNTAKINVNSVKQNLNANKQLEYQCMIELKKLFAMNVSDTLTIDGEIGKSLPELIEVPQLQTSHLVESAALQLKQADMQVKLSRSALLPSISMNTYYGRQQFRDDFGLSFGNGSWTNYSYLSLNLSVPIFTGFSNRSKIKQSQLNQQIAFSEKQETEQHAALDDELLVADYRLSLADVQSTSETYQLYEKNKELTFQKYEEGLISLDGYLAVFEDYIKAENAYLNTLSKLYTYYSQIIPRIER
ncbi:MAG: TolC family protein [Bacteroidota bacterium]